MEFDYRNTNRELLNNLYNLSILIPSYGNEQYIEQTIASLYNQSFKPNGAEIIIGVDGDHSLLEKVIDIRKDNRETYDFKIFYCPENKGLFTMKNTLLKVRNQSNDVLWFDSDDVMNKELLYNILHREGDIKRFRYSMLLDDKEYKQPVYDFANGSLYITKETIDKIDERLYEIQSKQR